MGRYVKWCCFLDLRCIRLANPKRITISGYLPVVSNYYRMASGGWTEMTAVPKADMGGSMEQRCFYRFQKVDGSGNVTKTQFYDTFAYTAGGYQSPAQVPASGEPPGPNSHRGVACSCEVVWPRRAWGLHGRHFHCRS